MHHMLILDKINFERNEKRHCYSGVSHNTGLHIRHLKFNTPSNFDAIMTY